ncbi:MAG: P pilus assembly/Cpx signaling pathway, periplasmic inhibitor/zinc-resistance associated protein [Nodularia sp. (in: cyanobacteria)]|nr:P pilus assembly/Cpx signaling pathway, periplasmic inhibitor/zinc-resistance associated protein [Nodularia sp. (in: cyanobacteria)]
MKLKPLSLLAGAIALTVTAIPFAVQAQMRSSSPLQMAQMPGRGKGERGPWQRLNLTEAQKAQMQTIRSNTRAQIEAILTPEQKATLAAAKEARQAQRQAGQAGQGQRGPKGWANLNLTEQQKTQLRQIRESSQQQIQAVLTPEQRQQMQEMRQNMRRQQPNSQ